MPSRTLRRALLVVALVVVAAGVTVTPAAGSGGRTVCNGSYTDTSLHGGVVVPSGDTCTLSNVTVNGGMQVEGGAIDVQNTQINGGLTIDNLAPSPYVCGTNVNGGLTVENIASGATLALGEANADCPGGTINGGATFMNNSNAFLEIDGYQVNGGLQFLNNIGGGEIEGMSVNGAATCTSAYGNDEGGPNSYTGPNNGCPA
jgi:hypothetical protein